MSHLGLSILSAIQGMSSIWDVRYCEVSLYYRFNERQQCNRTERIWQSCVLAEWSKKINRILKHVRTENIADTNVLIKAFIVYVGKKIDLKAWGSKNKNKSEPWWKRRIKKTKNEFRKHINILERQQRGQIRRKEKYQELERKHNI